jgi:hypothetical protein
MPANMRSALLIFLAFPRCLVTENGGVSIVPGIFRWGENNGSTVGIALGGKSQQTGTVHRSKRMSNAKSNASNVVPVRACIE